jgi:hypothetical protein
MAGHWLNPDTGLIVKVASTHDEWLRDRQHALDLGLTEADYQEIMSYPPTDIDPIRLVGLRRGLVRVREHRRHVSVQFMAEAARVGIVLAATVRGLMEVGIHPDTRLIVDNLLLGDSRSVMLGGLADEMGLGTLVALRVICSVGARRRRGRRPVFC